MPAIPVYDPSNQIARGLDIPQGGAEAVMQAGYHAQREIRGAGEAIGGAIREYGAHEDIQQTSDLTTGYTKTGLQKRQEWKQELATNPKADPEQFFKDKVDPDFAKLDEIASTEKARAHAANLHASISESFLTQAYAEVAQLHKDSAQASVDNLYNTSAATLRDNPAALASETKTARIAASGIFEAAQVPAQQKELYLQQKSREQADAAADGLAHMAESSKSTPMQREAARAAITDPKGNFHPSLTGGMSQAKYGEVIDRLDKADATQGVVDGYIAQQQFDDVRKAIRENGGIDTGGRGQALIGQISGATATETAKMQYKAGRDLESDLAYGKATRDVMTAPSTALKPAADSIQAAIGKETDPEKLRQLEADQSAVHDAMDKRKHEYADPAAYTIKYSPTVANTYQAFAQQPTPETAAAFFNATAAEQKRLEPYQTPSLLPKEEADRVGSAIASAKLDANGVAQATSVLQGEAQLSGRYWPQVAQELFHKHAINETQFVAASLFGKPGAAGIAQELMQASMMKPEELETGNTLSLKQANAAAAVAINPLRQSLHYQSGGDQLADAYQNALSNLLLSRAKTSGGKGNPNADAVNVARIAINGDYTFSGSLRIPTGAGDPSLIESGTAQVQADLKNHKLVIPPSYSGMRAGPQHDDYLLTLQTHGQWVANGDESGAKLLDPNGNEVTELKDGKEVPLQLSWKELAGNASTTAKTWYKTKHVGDVKLGDVPIFEGQGGIVPAL